MEWISWLMGPLAVWLVFINLLAFALFGVDKRRAKRHSWRIRETSLLLTAVLGGSLGALLGMLVFRHKTRHGKFMIGVPVLLAIHVAIWFWLRFILP